MSKYQKLALEHTNRCLRVLEEERKEKNEITKGYYEKGLVNLSDKEWRDLNAKEDYIGGLAFAIGALTSTIEFIEKGE